MPSMRSFDDAALLSAMRDYVSLSDRLAVAASDGQPARELVDLAEAKALAGLVLHKRLADGGWSAPTGQGAAQVAASDPLTEPLSEPQSTTT